MHICFMSNQYEKGVQNEKVYLMLMESKMCLYYSMSSERDSINTVKRTESKEVENSFL